MLKRFYIRYIFYKWFPITPLPGSFYALVIQADPENFWADLCSYPQLEITQKHTLTQSVIWQQDI